MNSFYKKNSSFINYFLFASFVGVSIACIVNTSYDAKLAKEVVNLEPISHRISKHFLEDLTTSCNSFKSDIVSSKIRPFADKNNIDFNITKASVVKIDDLLFEKLTLVVYHKENDSINIKFFGYIVTNTENKKCFGLI